MRIGLREILLVAAVVLFVLAALTNDNAFDFLAFGLACLAAGLVVADLGIGTGFGNRR